MSKEFTSLGLMSGTSGDGVDASIIKSNGNSKYKVISDNYFQYDNEIYEKIHSIKENVRGLNDLKKQSKELNNLERLITLFHAKIIKELQFEKIDLIGFHGQTLYHNPKEKISKQLGDGKLLSQLVKKNVIYKFRQNDINNGGEGAPLTPIFHQLIATQLKLDLPVCFLNIGGISNITIVNKPVGTFEFTSRDIGPGNCLIDNWIRKNSEKKYDKNGLLAAKGICNKIILEQAQELFANRSDQKFLSLDVNDFDVSFVRGLSLEDGSSTLTELTAMIISSILSTIVKNNKNSNFQILVSGGGRKNSYMMKRIRDNSSNKLNIKSIDDHGIDGDFVESQAFAFLAIRSFLNLPISFPQTTGCEISSTGGELIKFE